MFSTWFGDRFGDVGGGLLAGLRIDSKTIGREDSLVGLLSRVILSASF